MLSAVFQHLINSVLFQPPLSSRNVPKRKE